MPFQNQKTPVRKRDPHVDFKRDASRIKLPPGTEIKPDVELQPDTSGWLTRQDSAAFLGVSVTTIVNYERRGKLNPRYDYRTTNGFEQRVTLYDPKQLAPLRKYAPPSSREKIKDPGELAASCFELLDQGRTLREIVVALRETPEQINMLRESWLDAGGSALTITPLAKERLEKVVGEFSGVADLVTLVEDLARRASGVMANAGEDPAGDPGDGERLKEAAATRGHSAAGK